MEITRPCFLVIDREHSSSISTRKLVIETAKFNVLTAYSPVEGVEMLRRFPDVDGVVMNADIQEMSCDEVISLLREIVPKMRVVVIGPSGRCKAASHTVESFEPARLLDVLRDLCPQQANAIESQNEKLNRQE